MRHFWIIGFGILIISCENSQKPTLDTPGTVSWVEKSAEMAADERGVDAIPESDGVFLQWYKLRDRGIKYYNIYRKRPNETFFGRIQQINIENATEGRDTTYIDGDSLLNDYQSYYITAENSDGVEGQASDTIRYNLLDKPETTKPNFETVVGMPIFFWSFVTIIPHEFILRIEQDYPPFGLYFAQKFQSDYDNNTQVLDLGQISNPPLFETNLWYKWRIDAIGTNEAESGSESQWLRFKVQ
jgi:hypothetical protein